MQLDEPRGAACRLAVLDTTQGQSTSASAHTLRPLPWVRSTHRATKPPRARLQPSLHLQPRWAEGGGGGPSGARVRREGGEKGHGAEKCLGAPTSPEGQTPMTRVLFHDSL